MSEVIYVLMIAFVGYVIYTVVTDKNGSKVDTHYMPALSTEEAGTVEAVVAEVPAAKPVAEAAMASPVTPAVEVQPVVQAAVAGPAENTSDEIKNPKTGEVSKIPNNYRFGKRWIKEALVAEKLLDKVYRNNEVNDAVSTKAQVAMAALKNMDKYRV